jgi:hypothetical protein
MTMPNVAIQRTHVPGRADVRTRVLIHAGVTPRVFAFLDEPCDVKF